jgi:glycine cleavage system H protein
LAERRYSESHEWVTLEGNTATVGISDFAQAQLGDVVFLELPRVGESLTPGQSFGVVESVKAASDLYAPIAGKVVAVNEKLTDSPDLVNRDPYGDGWLLQVELEGGLPDNLLDEDAYTRTTGQ